MTSHPQKTTLKTNSSFNDTVTSVVQADNGVQGLSQLSLGTDPDSGTEPLPWSQRSKEVLTGEKSGDGSSSLSSTSKQKQILRSSILTGWENSKVQTANVSGEARVVEFGQSGRSSGTLQKAREVISGLPGQSLGTSKMANYDSTDGTDDDKALQYAVAALKGY